MTAATLLSNVQEIADQKQHDLLLLVYNSLGINYYTSRICKHHEYKGLYVSAKITRTKKHRLFFNFGVDWKEVDDLDQKIPLYKARYISETPCGHCSACLKEEKRLAEKERIKNERQQSRARFY